MRKLAIRAIAVTMLSAPPVGCFHMMVDGDLVKLAVGTKLVVDAIEGLVR